MAKVLLLSALGLLVGVTAVKLLVGVLEPHLTFFPLRGLTSTPQKAGIPYQEMMIPTRDGEDVHTWVLYHPEARAEVVFFHGNGGNLSLWLNFLLELYQQSLTVLALDYRGYGKSTGSPTEAGLYEDTAASVHHFWDHVHRPSSPVLYWGRSLGGVMAAYATTVRKPDGLVLEATFSDKGSLLHHYPLLRILATFSRYRFPTAEFLRDLDRPVLVIHGTHDEVVPFAEGQKLFHQLNTEKYFYEIRGADHGNLHLIEPEHYQAEVEKFIEKLESG